MGNDTDRIINVQDPYTKFFEVTTRVEYMVHRFSSRTKLVYTEFETSVKAAVEEIVQD